jgi:esterase/lipase superfamily enzyme
LFKHEHDATKDDLIPSNSNILLYVHGHTTRFFRFIGGLMHLRTVANSWKGCENVKVFGFLWPSHMQKVSYVQSRAKTQQAGLILRQCIRALQSRGNSVSVCAYSMGSRVALTSLLCGPDDGELLKPLESLFLIAAAVSSNVFTTEFRLQNLKVKRICNFFSDKDEVLSDGFFLGEIISGGISLVDAFTLDIKSFALGKAGIDTNVNEDTTATATSASIQANETTIAIDTTGDYLPKVENVDLSNEVSSHSNHAYFCSAIFQSKLGYFFEPFFETTKTSNIFAI